MTTYQVRVAQMEVFAYDKVNGQGKHLHSKDGFEIGKYSTLPAARESVKEYFGHEPDSNEICEDYVSMTQLENSEGEADTDGKYIVDYVIEINKIEPISLIGPDIWYHKNDPRV